MVSAEWLFLIQERQNSARQASLLHAVSRVLCCHVPAFGVKGNADLSHDEDDVGIFW